MIDLNFMSTYIHIQRGMNTMQLTFVIVVMMSLVSSDVSLF